MLLEPVGKLSEACLIVNQDAMTQSPIFTNETDVEFEFRDINTEDMLIHVRLLLMFKYSRGAQSNLLMQALLLKERLQIPSDLQGARKVSGARELI
jgi:hypothetical protein